MIKLEELTSDDVGREVIFWHSHGKPEPGILSSWNDKYIFCRFTTGSTAAACDPKQLRWSHPS